MQYKLLKNKTVQYILDYEPTQEQLAELGCDSYEEYREPEETLEHQNEVVVEVVRGSIK